MDTVKALEKIEQMQLFYELLTTNIISTNPAGQIKNLREPHMAPGP